MPTRLPAALLALSACLATAQPAAALPRTSEALQAQLNICKRGLEMVYDGASDDEELEMYEAELDYYGWHEAGDLEDLMLLCAFYKQGWLLHATDNS